MEIAGGLTTPDSSIHPHYPLATKVDVVSTGLVPLDLYHTDIAPLSP